MYFIEVELTFRIVENRKVVVQTVDFNGNESVPASKFRRFLQVKPGGVVPWLTSSGTFQREKLARVITIALRKRPVSTEQIDQIVSGIARKLESSGETEVASQDIGELAMESLRVVDPVGYVRYASVYRDFDAPSDFAAFIKQSELDED